MPLNKDPSFPFYAQDFLIGVMHLSMEERGMYITLLAYQWDKKEIPKKRLGFLVGYDWDKMPDSLKEKFVDSGEIIYNKRLEAEREKRRLFNEKQKNNGKKGGRPPKDNNLKTQTKPKESLRVENDYEKEKEKGNENGNANEAENGTGLIYQMHQLWLNAWPDYIPDDLKDITALRGISIKLKRLVEKRSKDNGQIRAAMDSEVIDTWNYIITNYPKWYRDNLVSLSGLNSKFNDLIATLQKKTEHDEQSAKDLAYILSSD